MRKFPDFMKHHALILLAGLGLAAIPAAAAAQAQFKAQTIDGGIGIGYGLAVSDVNGDGKPDILLVDKQEVVCYENPTWKKHVLSGPLTKLDHVCIAARDIDGDGKAEIAVGAGWNPGDTVGSGAVFYLVPPQGDRFGSWSAVQLPHEPTVHRMHWLRKDDETHTLVVAPLHGRGNKNGEGEGVRMLEYVASGDRSKAESWKTVEISRDMHMTHNLDVTPGWRAGMAEGFLLAGREGLQAHFMREGNWQTRMAVRAENAPGFEGAGEVRLGRLGENQMFLATIEKMHGDKAVVYFAEGERGPDRRFSRKVLDATLADGHALATGDFTGAGSDQVVVGWRGKNAEGKFGLKLFVPKDGGASWDSTWIDDGGMACEDVKVADLNGDGRPDLVAAGRGTKNVKIYWNESGK